MRHEDYDEDEVETTNTIEAKDPDTIKVTASIAIATDRLDAMIEKYIKDNLKLKMDTMIKSQVDSAFRTEYEKYSLHSVMREVITEKFRNTYPDIVENKVNEFHKKIMSLEFNTRDFDGRNFQEAAMKKVMTTIDSELKEVITKVKAGIDDYAKNYFTRNLFKAMNLMDSVLSNDQQAPQIK